MTKLLILYYSMYGHIEIMASITSLIAAVELGRGVAVIAQPINGLANPRLKILPLQPAPPPLAVGMVC